MVNWITLAKGRYFSADKMNSIYKNFEYINRILANTGYTIYELTDNTVTYDISPAAILEKMNAVESNIQAIENATDWINPYYALFEWVHNTDNKKIEVDRWINYLNFVYSVLFENFKPSQFLIDSDGNYIVDKNGNYILVYKETKNG